MKQSKFEIFKEGVNTYKRTNKGLYELRSGCWILLTEPKKLKYSITEESLQELPVEDIKALEAQYWIRVKNNRSKYNLDSFRIIQNELKQRKDRK